MPTLTQPCRSCGEPFGRQPLSPILHCAACRRQFAARIVVRGSEPVEDRSGRIVKHLDQAGRVEALAAQVAAGAKVLVYLWANGGNER